MGKVARKACVKLCGVHVARANFWRSSKERGVFRQGSFPSEARRRASKFPPALRRWGATLVLNSLFLQGSGPGSPALRRRYPWAPTVPPPLSAPRRFSIYGRAPELAGGQTLRLHLERLRWPVGAPISPLGLRPFRSPSYPLPTYCSQVERKRRNSGRRNARPFPPIPGASTFSPLRPARALFFSSALR